MPCKERALLLRLWFDLITSHTEELGALLAREQGKPLAEAKAEIVEKPHLNPAANHREVWIRDPDGYIVVLASPEGDTDG